MMIALPCAAILAIGYWMYKKFREPFYNPGMVAKAVAEDEESKLDSPDLYSKSTKTIWMMPDGIEIYHFPPPVNDNKKPRVLAVHGGPAIAPSKPWNLCDYVANIHLYHARGCGKSSRPFQKFPTPGKMWPGMKTLEETLGLGAQILDIERIRRRLSIDNNGGGDGQIDLVGHSFGGFVAAMYAAEFPQNVRSLTLLVPAAVLVLPSKNKNGKTEDLFQIVQEKLEEIGNQDHIEEYKAFMKRYLDFGSLPNETETTLAQRQNDFAIHYFRAMSSKDGSDTEPPEDLNPSLIGGMACYATFLSMGIEHNYISACQERLRNSTFPVAIVHGTKDMIPASTTQKYVQLFPTQNINFYTVQDADHSLFDHPEAVKIVKETLGRATK